MKRVVSLALLLVTAAGNAQHTSWTVEMKGYLITMGGNMVHFQPCQDEVKTSFLEALDSTSISLDFDFSEKQSLVRFLMGIGDSINVDIYEGRKKWDMHGAPFCIYYFYCEIEVMLFLFDWGGVTRSRQNFEFFYNGKFYPLSGLTVRNRTLKIIPSRKEDLVRLIGNYRTAGHRMPKWLSEADYSK